MPTSANAFASLSTSLRRSSPNRSIHIFGGGDSSKAATHAPTKIDRDTLQPPNRIASRKDASNCSVVDTAAASLFCVITPRHSSGSCNAWGRDHPTRLMGDERRSFMTGCFPMAKTASSNVGGSRPNTSRTRRSIVHASWRMLLPAPSSDAIPPSSAASARRSASIASPSVVSPAVPRMHASSTLAANREYATAASVFCVDLTAFST
mmetsp:Transcript_18516/g.39773  ORF Transcript_18516/g.39773 Transcript_18516/m.39773 type:complete len:207 (+) Transcript_18516:210-830(+)